MSTVTICDAERRAREFSAHFPEDRYTVEVRISEEPAIPWTHREGNMLPATTTVAVFVREHCTGGYLHVFWTTVHGDSEHRGGTRFLGGRYRFASLGKEHRLRKSMPHLSRVADIMLI